MQPTPHHFRRRLTARDAFLITLLFCLAGASALTAQAQGKSEKEPKAGKCVVGTINPATLPQGVVGVPYSQALSTSHLVRAKFSLSHGSLPPGLQLTVPGRLTGTPTSEGTWKFIVVATDENNCTAVREYTLKISKICAPITLFPSALPDAQVGQKWSVSFSATGGNKPYQFMIVTGALPGWAILVSGSNQHVEYAGTPSLPGVYTFTMKVIDANQCTTQRAFTLTVHESPWPQPQQSAQSAAEFAAEEKADKEAQHRQPMSTDRASNAYSRDVTGTVPQEVEAGVPVAGNQETGLQLAPISITPTASRLKSGYIPSACYPYLHSDTLVDCWLQQHPNIANAIVWWFDYEQSPKAYPQWDRQAKQSLMTAFGYARNWLQNGMSNYSGKLAQDPPPNLTDPQLVAGQPAYQIIAEDDAWRLYIGQVGVSLAIEIYGYVPWSLRSYNTVSLGQLFNAYTVKNYEGLYNSSRFWPSADAGANAPAGYINFGITPANATYTYKFLRDKNLVGATPKETIGRMLQWSHQLWHFIGDHSAENHYDHWRYYPGQTVSRTIEGTVLIGPNSFDNLPHHWTAGCGSTSAFLRELLRVVNIPSSLATVGLVDGNGHGAIWFSGENLFLSHGDDPYDRGAQGYPPQDLLINEQTFKNWFRLVSPETGLQNVGRQVKELATNYPGSGLLDSYCKDVKDGKSHAASRVAAYFKPLYTVAQLEALGVWDRLAQKAQLAGTCQP